MAQDSRGSSSQSFGPTSGLVTGWFASALFFLVGLLLVTSDTAGWGALVLAVGLVLWCFLARPRIVLEDGTLELRNAFSSWLVPLGLVEDVSVRHATVVTAAGRTYVGDAVGRSALEVLRGQERSGLADRLLAEIQREKKRTRKKGEVIRTWAVAHLVVIALLLLAFLVL